MQLSNNTIGIDEVGRWPLAWPVWVGGVLCLLPPSPSRSSDGINYSGGLQSFFEIYPWAKDVQDSKKLSVWQREYLASCILSDPNIVCATSLVSAKYIDRYGIVAAIRKASLQVIEEIRDKIGRIGRIEKVVLDGKTDYGLRQHLDIPLETIIKWDQKIRQIAAASIIAKVQRDQYMVDLARKKKYQLYQFDRHKGYGTVMHRNAISAYNLSDEHRRSFIHFV